MRTYLFLVVLGALLAACGDVDSAHPLSDPASSSVDLGLVGYWGLAPDDQGPWQAEEVRPVLTIGRSEATPNALEAALVRLEEGKLHVDHLTLQTTLIDGRRYLSFHDSAEEEARYHFLRYALDETGAWLQLDAPAVAFFAKAVLDGQLAGSVDGDDEDLSLRQVHLEADTATLRKWVKAHQDAAFVEGDPRGFQRLRERAVKARDAKAEAAQAEPPVPPPLSTKTSLEVSAASGRAVLETLAKRAGRPLHVTAEAEARLAGVRVTLHYADVALQDVLDVVTQPYGLTWHVDDDALVVDVAAPGKSTGGR